MTSHARICDSCRRFVRSDELEHSCAPTPVLEPKPKRMRWATPIAKLVPKPKCIMYNSGKPTINAVAFNNDLGSWEIRRVVLHR